MADLMTFRQYADHAGINVSTVSRAVDRGYIPIVAEEGERRIDPIAADKARSEHGRANRTICTKEQRLAAAAKWRAKAGDGFDHGQHLLLGVLLAHGPRLVADGMRMMGAKTEKDIALASAAMHEIIMSAAAVTFDDRNQRGVRMFSSVLPKAVPPTISAEAMKLYVRLTNPEADPDFDRDAEPWPSEWDDMVFDALKGAELR